MSGRDSFTGYCYQLAMGGRNQNEASVKTRHRLYPVSSINIIDRWADYLSAYN